MSNEQLLEIYNSQASSVLTNEHTDYHDDQILEGSDGWPDEHLDRHYDEYFRE